jgi:3-hydroxyisobutyrate dehydrogenase-like beta-hydroxyacid dehydrogenase
MQKLAYLGLGVMGRGMASNLLEAGYELTVWNRTAEKADPLLEQGARRAESPSEAAEGAEAVLYCLVDRFI